MTEMGTSDDSGEESAEQDVSIPTPESEGYALGSDPCLDRCWADFQRCLDTTNFPPECIARLEACKRGCAQQAPAPQPCDQSCPTCASDRQMTNPCTLTLGHGGNHQCSYGDQW